jgi:hypothetical protein
VKRHHARYSTDFVLYLAQAHDEARDLVSFRAVFSTYGRHKADRVHLNRIFYGYRAALKLLRLYGEFFACTCRWALCAHGPKGKCLFAPTSFTFRDEHDSFDHAQALVFIEEFL